MKLFMSIVAVLNLINGESASFNPPSFEEIEDLSSLSLLNPDLAERKIAKLRLSNGFEALVISDSGADQSAAAVAVGAGSWDDPLDYPGMAHFCEHMLFMGTQKYPSESEFSTLISDYAGMTNAFTAPNQTVYMFSSETGGYLPLLDRFAHFFIDPLFNPANIAREMHAVDQEFAKNIEHDGWREYMIFKETGNPQHPNRLFSTGNSETLGKIPQSALVNWHRKYYSAERMRLVLYSSLPLKVLKETVAQTFNAIPKAREMHPDHSYSLSSTEQRGHITYVKPIQNLRRLTLSWELPSNLSDDPTKSADVLAYALQRGQNYSLYEKLKEEQLIDSMSIRVDELGGKEHRFFQITLDLTQAGLEQIDTTVFRCFQAIAGIKKNGIPAYLFQEKNAVAKLNYQYQSRQNAFDYIMKLGSSLFDEPLSTYPRGILLASEYSAQKIEELAELLHPESCALSLIASPELTKVIPEHREKWFGAEYAIHPIPSEWLSHWSKAAPTPEIKIAEPNPFLPTEMGLVLEKNASSTPMLISDTDLGIAYYVRSSEFPTPESVYHLYLLSPEINPSARSSVLASIYLDHLTDLLHPQLSAASLAGLNCRFDLDRSRIHLQIYGFSEKAPVLLREIARRMPLNPPSPEQFALYVSRHEKNYLNAQRELAARQAKDLLDSVINQDKTTKKEKLAALRGISYEDFLSYHEKLFEKTYLEALFAGNLKVSDAQSAWLDVVHLLGKTPFPKEEHPQTKILELPESHGPFSIRQSTLAQGNATLLLIDEGGFTFENRAASELLSVILHDAFFNELRTKQKTGYIAQSNCSEIEERLFQIFLVQSNSHQPEELLFRFELFIEEFNETLAEKISPERFLTLKASLISSLKNRYRSLQDKAALWNLLCFEKDGDFVFVEKRLAALEALSLENFLSISNKFLSRDNRKRLGILFEGKLAEPFAYHPVGIPQLGDIAGYAARPGKKKSSLENGAAAAHLD
ncbi:MAG: insulinase family protein [Chlamydiota bacterium]